MTPLEKEENVMQLLDTAVEDDLVASPLRTLLVTERDALNRGEAIQHVAPRLYKKVMVYKNDHHVNIESIDDLLQALKGYTA